MRWLILPVMALVFAAQQAAARPAVDAVQGRPPPPVADNTRCTDDGRDCIRLEHYVADVCKLIERNASENGLDPNFLARLLWKESRFEPNAISPAGALGIAQFMPGTARLYDLDDPMNPAQAISKSAWYLARLRDGFGNIGLAAVAYNGGENRAARFIAGQTVLPYETQDYVEAITGHNAWRWRDNPPATEEIKLALDPDRKFRPACEELAANRTLREFMTQPPASPWGVIIASHANRAVATRMVARMNRSLRPLLGEKKVGYVRRSMRGGTRPVYTAQIGFNSRSEAQAMCVKYQRLGGRCIVLKN